MMSRLSRPTLPLPAISTPYVSKFEFLLVIFDTVQPLILQTQASITKTLCPTLPLLWSCSTARDLWPDFPSRPLTLPSSIPARQHSANPWETITLADRTGGASLGLAPGSWRVRGAGFPWLVATRCRSSVYFWQTSFFVFCTLKTYS